MPTAPDSLTKLLFWDFDNVMNDRNVSIAVGVPSEPHTISGFVSQTGGGPAEVFGDGVGTVFLTRYLGTFDCFLWFTVTRPIFFAGLTFRHFHNHNPGFPTGPKYSVQLQIDSGDGYANVGKPLELSSDNFGGTDTIEVGRELEPGGYKLRWHPKGLKNKARDTNSEFFAMKNLALMGRVLAGAAASPTPCAAPASAPAAPAPAVTALPPAKIGDFISVEIAGVTVERFKVMESKFGGKCARTGTPFAPGAIVGFKHRDSVPDDQKAAIFGTKKPTHLMVLLPDPELDVPADSAPVCCTPDATRLDPFRKALARASSDDEWMYGNLSSLAAAFSCGHLTRGPAPDHRHSPAELARCKQLARESAAHLRTIRLEDEAGGAPFVPYFVTAVLDAPVPTAINEALIRSVFGGTIAAGVPVQIETMNDGGWWWESLVNNHHIPTQHAALTRSWNAFMDWFRAVPGLREHSFVMIGRGDDEPGATKPRIVVALTETGSLVGAASYVVYA